MGRLLAEPFGADGLKVAEAREIVSLMSAPPVGSGVGVLVAGPMDLATTEAQDALLKHIEEFDHRVFQPILWARDAGGVLPTIRSRCFLEWCPHGVAADLEFEQEAQGLVRAALERDRATTVGTLKEFAADHKKEDPSTRAAAYRNLLASVAMVIADRLKGTEGKDAEELLALWESVRPALCSRRPTPLETLGAVLLPHPDSRTRRNRS
jgi:hypothetical protein